MNIAYWLFSLGVCAVGLDLTLVRAETNNKNVSKLNFKKNDPYDVQEDKDAFIRKLKIQQDFVIKNNKKTDVLVTVEFERLNEPNFFKDYSIRKGEKYIVHQNGNSRLARILLKESAGYLNPQWLENDKIEFHIDYLEDKFFLYPSYKFSFEANPFTEEELDDVRHASKTRGWMRHFNRHQIEYFDTVLCKCMNMSLKDVESHRRDLFDKYCPAKILEHDPGIIDRADSKIPLITHHIWVTNNENPIELPESNFRFLENSIITNSVSNGWKHYIWIEDRAKLPDFAKRLEHRPDFTLMEVKNLGVLFSGDLFKEAIAAGQLGKAADIIRLEILYRYGGFYMDTDFEVFHSLKPYAKFYDFVAGLEPMTTCICNAFIGTRPNHPIISKYLELIIHNLTSSDRPAYITKLEQGYKYKTVYETGPAILTLAFALSGGLDQNIDIVMPPRFLCPARYKDYPCNFIVQPDDPAPAESIGAHYWENLWLKPDFGSHG